MFRVWWLEKGNRGQGAGNRDQGSGIRDQLPVLATMWTGIPYLHQLHCLHCFLMAQEHGLAANRTILLRCGMRGFQSRGNYSTYVLFLEVFSSNSFRRLGCDCQPSNSSATIYNSNSLPNHSCCCRSFFLAFLTYQLSPIL